MTTDDIVEQITRLSALEPIDAAGVERVLGAPLRPGASQPYFAELSGVGPGYDSVSLRLPLAGATAGPSVGLRLDPATCVPWQPLADRLGHLFRVAHPHRADGPEVWRSQAYDARGELYLSFDPTSGCLTEVNLHHR